MPCHSYPIPIFVSFFFWAVVASPHFLSDATCDARSCSLRSPPGILIARDVCAEAEAGDGKAKAKE